MPTVKILRNIGTTDCATLGLEPQSAREGRVLSVDQAVADELIRCGLGEIAEEQAAQPRQQQQQHRQPPPPPPRQ